MRFSGMVVFAAMTLALVAPTTWSGEVPPGLKDGDTIVFYGDSITHHNDYVAYLYLFYATRYPEARIRFCNAGVGGNRTASALPRFRQDVAEQSPALVAVLFGMNDGNQRAFEEKTFQAYQKGMGTILKRIETETKARALLLTPTFFDYPVQLQHLKAGQTADATYNEVLVRFGDYLKALGKEKGCPAIDLNAPMAETTRRLQAAHPDATLSRDGIHPLPGGHFVMARAILRGLGVTGTVSEVQIDATVGVQRQERCQVTNLAVNPGGLAFDLTQASLPYPCPEEVRGIIAPLGFNGEWNRERLRISGLGPGPCRLTIDGEAVGVFTADQLAAGIDLAANTATPQYHQAVAVISLWTEWRKQVKQQRDFRLMEKALGYRRPDGSYPGKGPGTIIIDEHNEAIKVSGEEWQRRFDEMAAEAPGVVERIAALEKRIHAAAQPRTHRYELRRRE